jgi:hypothetical protein
MSAPGHVVNTAADSVLAAFMSGWRSRRGRNWFGAAVLIAVGVIGLIANFDLLPRQMLEQMWKLWPVIPLLIGISILVRRSIGDDNSGTGGR